MLKKSDLMIYLLFHHNKLDLDRVVSIGVYLCADDFLIWLQQELLGATLLPLPRHVFEFVAGPVEERHAQQELFLSDHSLVFISSQTKRDISDQVILGNIKELRRFSVVLERVR
jgi:hypothetical protein